jgi:hypothetical protein
MTHQTRNLQRIAGLVLIAGPIASIAALALDQGASASDTRTLLQQIAAAGPAHELAHAVQMACVTGYAFAFSVLATRLDLRRAPVLAGLIAYGLGVGMMLIATVNDGFLTTAVAQRFAAGPAEDLETARNLIRFCGMAITWFGDLAFVLMAVGAALWSLVLVRRGGLARMAAVAGLVGGAGTLGAVVLQPRLDMGALMGIVLAQACFEVLVGVVLTRGLDVAEDAPEAFGGLRAAA